MRYEILKITVVQPVSRINVVAAGTDDPMQGESTGLSHRTCDARKVFQFTAPETTVIISIHERRGSSVTSRGFGRSDGAGEHS